MAKKDSGAVAEAPAHTVRIEDAGPCRKRLKFEIPAARITELVESKMDDLASSVALPGFRAGRAPRTLVQRRFGPAVRDEVMQQVTAEAYQAAIKDHDLRVLGNPEGGEELKDADLSGAKPLSFSLEVEVAPEIGLPAVDGVQVLKPLVEVTDEMVDRELTQLQTNEGDLDKREASEAGDYCVGHGVMKTDNGEEALNIQGAVIQLPTKEKKGEGMILGVKVADFTKQVGAPGPGETVTVKTKGPENHENEAVRGKPITIDFTVSEVYRIIPASVERLCEKFGIESEERLREAIMLRLNQKVLIDQQSAMRAQIARKLLEGATLDLPERITARQAERNLARRRFELLHRGVDAAKIEEHMAELRSASAEVAQRELKLFFILDKIATDNNVNVTQSEVNGRVAQMAASRGQRLEELRSELIRTGQINGVAQQIREHKALDLILSKAKIEEVSAEEYRKRLGAEAAAEAGAG